MDMSGSKPCNESDQSFHALRRRNWGDDRISERYQLRTEYQGCSNTWKPRCWRLSWSSSPLPSSSRFILLSVLKASPELPLRRWWKCLSLNPPTTSARTCLRGTVRFPRLCDLYLSSSVTVAECCELREFSVRSPLGFCEYSVAWRTRPLVHVSCSQRSPRTSSFPFRALQLWGIGWSEVSSRV